MGILVGEICQIGPKLLEAGVLYRPSKQLPETGQVPQKRYRTSSGQPEPVDQSPNASFLLTLFWG
jgi:hypothetical protein